jgi:hypothetical protein
MTLDDKIIKFLSDRPALMLTRLEDEAGIPQRTFNNMKLGQGFPEKHWKKLKPVLIKYGWKD